MGTLLGIFIGFLRANELYNPQRGKVEKRSHYPPLMVASQVIPPTLEHSHAALGCAKVATSKEGQLRPLTLHHTIFTLNKNMREDPRT